MESIRLHPHRTYILLLLLLLPPGEVIETIHNDKASMDILAEVVKDMLPMRVEPG